MKSLRTLIAQRNDIAHKSMRNAQLNNEIVSSYMHEGQVAVYELIIEEIDKGRTKDELSKLIESMIMESQAKHFHSHNFAQVSHEEGRLIALSEVKGYL